MHVKQFQFRSYQSIEFLQDLVQSLLVPFKLRLIQIAVFVQSSIGVFIILEMIQNDIQRNLNYFGFYLRNCIIDHIMIRAHSF